MNIQFVPQSKEDGTFNFDDVRNFEVQAVTIIPKPGKALTYDRYQEEPGGDPTYRISEEL